MRGDEKLTDELLERETQLGALSALLDAALAGRGSVALVQGPAGIGKSGLLDAWVAGARTRAVDVLRASGDELVMDSSFATVRELFWPRLGEAGTAAFDGAARLAAPVFEGKLESGGRAESVGAVLHGLYWFVAGLADRGALALVVDDAHLLDVASARFLLYLARRVSSVPVLLVVAMQPADPVRLAELSQLAEQVLTLAPLTVQASATVSAGRSVRGRTRSCASRVTTRRTETRSTCANWPPRYAPRASARVSTWPGAYGHSE